MAIPIELQKIHSDYFSAHHNEYNMSTAEGCGQYNESWVRYAQNNGYGKVGHLKKSGTQTQYNGHAIDAFLYADGEGNPDGLFQAVDIIKDAETNHASVGWSIDIPRYTINDWMKEPNIQPNPNMVPWVSYDEQGFERLKRMLKHDYGRRPQGPDYDVSVWSGRYFHNYYMGPKGIPLGEQKSLERVKPELCAALGIPVACTGVNCSHPPGTIYYGE